MLTTDQVAAAMSDALPTHPIVAYDTIDTVEIVALGPAFGVYATVFPESATVGLTIRKGSEVVVHGAERTLDAAVAETVTLIGGAEVIAAFIPRAVA